VGGVCEAVEGEGGEGRSTGLHERGRTEKRRRSSGVAGFYTSALFPSARLAIL
jgi:hypothetical protein